jgi:hypothetical protein
MNGSRGSKRRWGLSPGKRRRKVETSSTEPLEFEGPTMKPVPVPELGVVPDFDAWDFLRYVDPIDDPAMLAFQVAQLTVGMAELKRRLDAMEEGNERG